MRGKIAFIAGGAGEVGEGIVRAFLVQGATVIVPSRTEAKINELRAQFEGFPEEQLITFVGNVSHLEGAEAVRDWILQSFGGLDIVVASLGGSWSGSRLTDVPLDTWQKILTSNLTAHFVVARSFFPLLLERRGTYVFINGGAAVVPIPNSGPISIVSAAQLMMKDVLYAENKEWNVRVNSIILKTPVLTRSKPVGNPMWLNADQVGRYTAWLASEAASEINGETLGLDLKAFYDVQP